MKKKTIGIVLILFSLTLMIFGLVYNNFVSNNVIPNKNNIVNNSDKTITVTSKDDENYTINKNGKVVDKNGNIVSNSSSSDNIKQNKTNSEEINSTNEDIKNNILNTYGIEILYGEETNNYKIGGLTTKIITDSNVINSELNLLNKLMSLYPTGFFNELDESIPLTIILVDSYSTPGVCGLTDSSYSKAVMSIAAGDEFSETFNHEIYHYMERYIYKNDGGFSNWMNYNPIGFNYGDVNDSFPVYNKTFSSDVYFVNSYSKTDQYEDRASIFEYLMSSVKASCLNKDMPVYYKAIAMSNVIDKYIETCSITNTEYWERYLVE